MRIQTIRPAIAMIELIFAIVVMGIVMMSAPMLISTASKSGYVAIQQEGIVEAATQVNIILGYQWDENNTQEEFYPVVLHTSHGNAQLEESGTTHRRAGTPIESFRKYISLTGEEANATAISWEEDPNAKDDIDDFNGTSVSLHPEETGGDADYIEKTTIKIERNIAYISDAESGTGTYANGGTGTITFKPDFNSSVAPTTNIKRIEVTLTTTSGIDELDKQIALHAFSCNIGSYKLEERP